MASKDRIYMDIENLDYAKHSTLLPSDRLIQFFIFMSLGFKERRKKKVTSTTKDKREMFLTHQRLTSLDEKHSLIYAVALYDKNRKYFENKKKGIESDEEFVNLTDEKEMYNIAEEYANGGAYYLRELEKKESLDKRLLMENIIMDALENIKETLK